MSSPPQNRVQRLAQRLGEIPRPDRHDPLHIPDSSSTTSASRPRATPGGRFRQLQQQRDNRLARLQREFTDNTTQLQEAGARLAQANEDLDHVLRQTSSEVIPAGRGQAHVQGDDDRRKRRRVENNDSYVAKQDFAPRNYGYYGQVVPGRLDMYLISSDGGNMDSDHEYTVDNMLKDDMSVYCTKSSRCNIVLGHKGGTNFTLERLVIKSPQVGFTSPIQEGLIFAAMEKDEVFDRTAKYQIHNYPTSRFATSREQQEASSHSTAASATFPTLEPRRPQNSMPLDNRPLPTDCWDSEEEDAEREANTIDNMLAQDRTYRPRRGLTELYRDAGLFYESPAEEDTSTAALDGLNSDVYAQQRDHARETGRQHAPTVLHRIHSGGESRNLLLTEPSDIPRLTRRRSRSPPTAAMALAIDEAAAPIWAQRSRAARRQPSPHPMREYRDIRVMHDRDFIQSLRRGNEVQVDRWFRRRRRIERERRERWAVREEEEARAREQAAREGEHEARAEGEHDPEEEAQAERERTVEQLSRRQRESVGRDDHAPATTPPAFELLTPAARFSMSSSHNDSDNLDPTSDSDTSSSIIHNPPFASASGLRRSYTGTRTTTISGHETSITFSPPLSAKYLLVKLWSSRRVRGEWGNIDVQSICAFGYAGVRWFPGVEMR